jgi:uncharacterized protein YodC (DUF2158 family)
MAYEVGDTVQLKSGGPAMTVVGLQNGKVQCMWFNKEPAVTTWGRLTSVDRDEFPEEALVHHDGVLASKLKKVHHVRGASLGEQARRGT